jgi:glucokinase
MVMWTLGTGIGCGIIIGMPRRREYRTAPSAATSSSMDNGRRCETGQYGTLEAYAGGRSLVQRCEEHLDGGRSSVLQKWIDQGEELTPLLMAKAAEEGDPLADELIMDAARCLGVGTTTLMHTIDPNMILRRGDDLRTARKRTWTTLPPAD